MTLVLSALIRTIRALSPPLGVPEVPALIITVPGRKTIPAGAVAVTVSPSAIGEALLKVIAKFEVSGPLAP